MKMNIQVSAVLAAILLIAACGKQDAPTAAGADAGGASKNSGPASQASSELDRLRAENSQLRSELTKVKKQVEELSLTPQVLLGRVNDALAADKVAEARQAFEILETRFSDSPQSKAAKLAIGKHDAEKQAREAQAKALEARGFYALQTQRAPTVARIVTVRVESLQLGKRWQFDVHGDEWHYRDAERGERYVLLRTTLQSTNKNPDLPDVGVYRIDGKKMIRLAQMTYEFRRWSSYGGFIGLHHDFKNDFAHTESIPFNAAASISEEEAKQPFAVVVSGELCHERGTQIGQPEVVYRLRIGCASKHELLIDDFAKGDYRIIGFFNKPKGL